MIYEVAGDLMLTKAQAVAHGVSPNDHFTEGLALALRENWPAMAKDFRHYAHQAHPNARRDLGVGGTGGHRVICLLTQDGDHHHGSKPGRASVSNVRSLSEAASTRTVTGQYKSLAMPKLATGVGGLDWADVKPLIEHHLGDLPIPIYL